MPFTVWNIQKETDAEAEKNIYYEFWWFQYSTQPPEAVNK